MKQVWDKVRIKSTVHVNVCFWQAKTDKCPISGSNDLTFDNLWKKKLEVNLNKFTYNNT
jgi:hypothetical protein